VKKLENKVAVITGAGGGLGLAMARLFAAQGAHVFVTDLDGAAAEEGAAAIRAEGHAATGLAADVTREADMQTLAAAVKEASPALHILVNNAGNLLRADFRHMGDAEWESVLNPHVWGTIRATRALLQLLQKGGAQGGAAIVNLSSIMATQHARQLSAYSTAKAAIAGLSRSLAVELAPYGIRVNYLCPGFIPTALTTRYTSNAALADALLRQMPLRRFGKPEEVAKAALFLASDDSSYITGEGIMVDGGMSLNLA
jgi:NAD(P)-dependent dehydrogenase (short-subunit alcohol dehydrogenase family)